MKFISTRDVEKKLKVTASQAIITGLAPDGGLFVPEEMPSLSLDEIQALCSRSYPERAATILGKYLEDYTYEELLEDCSNAYCATSFPGGAAPVKSVHDNTYSLELWHGPTAAFKDMALQIMPRLLSRALVKNNIHETALILVATSGDTGKAALEGYKDIPQIKIMVFYPVNGVSKVQQLQMATQTGANVNVCAIRGNFDDAQTGVKKIFGDHAFADQLATSGTFLSSANSINWGRLAPQIVYYVSAYCDLLNMGKIKLGEEMDVTVPTGNFGNIFAAYLAKKMGLPIRHFVCASNSNNVLTDFIKTGCYNRNREFHLTMSPSMDILISSNLERLLWAVAGSEKTASYMQQLKTSGSYQVDADVMAAIRAEFSGCFADEQATAKTINHYFDDFHYLADTHTAVGLYAADQYVEDAKSNVAMVVDSTASPYKFATDVYHSLFQNEEKPEPLSALDMLSKKTNTEIPYPLKGIGERTVRFTKVIDADEMPASVLEFANK